MKREYFYKEDGVVLPYHYCLNCGKQYKDDELEAGLIVNVGTGHTPIKYCFSPCMDIKFPPEPVKWKKGQDEVAESDLIEETVEA